MKRARFKPTKDELARAGARTVPDVIAPDLAILFVGINPGLYSGATRHHFARPGNRFWPALAAGGFTPHVVDPFDEEDLLQWRIGLTNMVGRSTNAADELSAEELRRGRRRLEAKVRRYRPAWVAVLGVMAYRIGFERPKAALGPQAERLEGARLWLLPNPSGLNAHHTPAGLALQFRALREAVEATTGFTSPSARSAAGARGPRTS